MGYKSAFDISRGVTPTPGTAKPSKKKKEKIIISKKTKRFKKCKCCYNETWGGTEYCWEHLRSN